MSGSLGTCPISPAANPANPAPSSISPSRLDAGTSLALGRAYMSTNCAKKNSTPPFSTSLRTSSSVAMLVSLLVDRRFVSGVPRKRDGGFLHRLRRRCVYAHCPQRGAEPHHPHGDLDEQPVLVAQVDPRELGDAPQPLTQRVLVDEQ